MPTTEVLAYSYAALRPSHELLERFLAEIDKLQKQGKICARDHQLLRSSTIAQEELMRLTLGDEAALTEITVTETLRRVANEIKKEESEKLAQEQESHRVTQQELAQTKAEREALQGRIYWRCKRKSHVCAFGASSMAGVLLVLGIATGFGLRSQNSMVGWFLLVCSSFVAITTLANLLFGTTARHAHEAIEAKCLAHFLHKEARATGINLGMNE